MEPSANDPMGAVEVTPMSKYGKKLKSFRKVVRTSFLNWYNGIMYEGIIQCIGRRKTRSMSDGIMYKIGRL